jgi:hypothetical protein
LKKSRKFPFFEKIVVQIMPGVWATLNFTTIPNQEVETILEWLNIWFGGWEA